MIDNDLSSKHHVNFFLPYLSHFSFGSLTENFPQTDAFADNLVKKVRTSRALETRIDAEWELEDFLVALKARMGPIKRLGCDALNIAIRLCRILWPEDPAPANSRGLAKKMMDTEDRLIEWRRSAARAGANEALT